MSMMSFEEILERDGMFIYTNVGDSMLPRIRQGQDLLMIKKRVNKPKKNDVILYRRDNGQYVLHRILYVRNHDYVICGDNRYGKEYGITDTHIVGILTAVIRDGKEVRLSGWKYRLYTLLWCDLFPIRSLLLRCRHVVRWMCRKTHIL